MTSDCNRRITEHERNCMDESILSYLTRHVNSQGELTDHDALRDLYVASLPGYIEPAWQAMHRWWQEIKRRPPACDQQPAGGIPVVFPSGRMLMLQYTATAANVREEPILDTSCSVVSTVDAAAVLGYDRAAELEEKSVALCEITSRVSRSFATAMGITAIANTVGQLHRMCPDLVRYVFPDTVKALQSQVRRSPVPDEWMRVDRSAVADMVNHLALCYLLPECKPFRSDFRQLIDGWCWAFEQNTVPFSAWSAHRGINKDVLHACTAGGNWVPGSA